MGKIIAIINHKGGVGKTTTAINFGAALHMKKKKVLLVDFDPQSNLTMTAQLEKESIEKNILGALSGEYELPIFHCKYYDAVPGSIYLAGIESKLTADSTDGQFYLKDKLVPYKTKYDYIIIDCPPSLGILTVNAMTASDEVIIPVQSGYYAMRGMEMLIALIERVKKRLNPNLAVGGILITMYKGRQNFSKSIFEIVQENYSGHLFKTVIRENTSAAEASYRGTVFDGKNSNSTEDYTAFTEEYLNQE